MESKSPMGSRKWQPLHFVRSGNRNPLVPRVTSILLAWFLATSQLHADFHDWTINEIYSNADGTVQFVELFCDQSGENLLAGQRLFCSKGSQTNVFTFPSNISGETRNKTLLLATSGFGSLPGGVTPNYILPTNFLFLGNGKINYANVDILTYTNLPSNGTASLRRTSNTFIAATNSPRNFASQSGSIVPVRISNGVHTGPNFLVSFATATGKNYTVEYKAELTNSTWQSVATVPGNGTIKTVTNAPGSATQRFYRLRAQ